MKRIIYTLAVIALGFSSCTLNNIDPVNTNTTTGNTVTVDPAQSSTDDKAIQAYITANNITAVKDPSGLYYKIITPGTGTAPTAATSTIRVTYTGTVLSTGVVFDQLTSLTDFKLSSLIQGWQVGLPLIKPGGRILLIVPSALAYGVASPSSLVPANSILIFDITLYSIS